MHLDKDILFTGNKTYSPSACVFLSPDTNTFLNDQQRSRGLYEIGVTYYPLKCKPFMSQCRDPFKRFTTYQGRYSTEEEAHQAWKTKKHEYACELAELEEDKRVKQALRTKYL
jgi:hypothetical protein